MEIWEEVKALPFKVDLGDALGLPTQAVCARRGGTRTTS